MLNLHLQSVKDDTMSEKIELQQFQYMVNCLKDFSNIFLLLHLEDLPIFSLFKSKPIQRVQFHLLQSECVLPSSMEDSFCHF